MLIASGHAFGGAVNRIAFRLIDSRNFALERLVEMKEVGGENWVKEAGGEDWKRRGGFGGGVGGWVWEGERRGWGGRVVLLREN